MLPHPKKWTRVTNELVMTFALKDCPKCEGIGAVHIDDQTTGERRTLVCPCADAPFKAEYAGRLRRNEKRRCLEIRGLAAVPEVIEVRNADDVEGQLHDLAVNGQAFIEKPEDAA